MTTAAPPRPAPEKRAAILPPALPATVPKRPGRSANAEAGDQGHPMPAPYRLELLTDDGSTTHVNVPADTIDGWDAIEAAVTSALTGKRYRPAGRSPRDVRA